MLTDASQMTTGKTPVKISFQEEDLPEMLFRYLTFTQIVYSEPNKMREAFSEDHY